MIRWENYIGQKRAWRYGFLTNIDAIVARVFNAKYNSDGDLLGPGWVKIPIMRGVASIVPRYWYKEALNGGYMMVWDKNHPTTTISLNLVNYEMCVADLINPGSEE